MSRFAATSEFSAQPPGRSAVDREFAQPAERVWGDIGKAPARIVAIVGLPQLDDFCSVRSADLSSVELPERVAPEDVPSVNTWVVHTECCAVEKVRQHPDILDRPSR